MTSWLQRRGRGRGRGRERGGGKDRRDGIRERDGKIRRFSLLWLRHGFHSVISMDLASRCIFHPFISMMCCITLGYTVPLTSIAGIFRDIVLCTIFATGIRDPYSTKTPVGLIPPPFHMCYVHM